MTLTPLTVFLALLLGWLGWLVGERVKLERDRAAVPLRISVTGTRGKTSVARLLAAVLREDGRKVLAKTTGSEARLIFPDGAEAEIHRLGAPSVLEQRKLLARGARLGVDAVVAEIMSVHPEAHRVEAHRILKPNLVLVTNFRVDHLAAQGETRGAVARVLALDVPPGGRALVP
jgi:poly-gamma-glutamate synthase PgsB/CapB